MIQNFILACIANLTLCLISEAQESSFDAICETVIGSSSYKESPVVFDSESRQVFEVEMGFHIDDIWSALPTTEGPVRIGGKLEGSIVNTIICYDPKRMISLKATEFPDDYEYKEAAQELWTIYYFAPISEKRTKITIVEQGYNDTRQSVILGQFFELTCQLKMRKLATSLAKQKAPGTNSAAARTR